MRWNRCAGRLQVSLLAPLMAVLALLWGGGLPGLPGRPGAGLPGLPGLPGGGTMPPLPGGGTTGPLPGHYFSGNYLNAAGTRSYLGYAPSSYKEGTPLPLV